MTILDQKIPPKVSAILATYGKSATIIVQSTRVYDPDTGATTDTNTTKSVTISPPAAFANSQVDRDVVKRGDMRVFLAANDLDFTPELHQRLIVDSVEYDVILVSPIYSGEQVAAYELGVRR